jgi:hypothetical protein
LEQLLLLLLRLRGGLSSLLGVGIEGSEEEKEREHNARPHVDFVLRILAPEKSRSHIEAVRVATCLGALLSVSALAVPSEATMLADWSLEEVLHRADSVVIGEVTSQSYVKVPDAERGEQLMTESHVRVEETLLGQQRPEIVLSQLGGVDGKVVSEIVGDAKLRVGQRIVVATYQHKDGRRYLVGMSLGFYEISGADGVQDIEASIFDRAGRVLPAPGRRTISMEALRAAIARERALRERAVP